MRSVRTSLAAVALMGLAPALAAAQNGPSPDSLLAGFQPIFKGVEYETPQDKAAIDACKVEYQTKTRAFILRDGQGKTLRRFVDTNGVKTQRDKEKAPTTHLDQWSYYQDGFEVYREVDKDEDGGVDEVRWLNAGGTRIAEVKGGKLIAWRRLSAEEASKVLTQAVIANDLASLETVMATPEELKALGLPDAGVVQKAAAARGERPARLKALRGKLRGWNGATWSRFDGMLPHVIPADATEGLAGDVLLYENAVVFAAPPNGGDPSNMAYLNATEVVRVGETWKFVDLPRAVDPGNKNPEPLVAGLIREAIFGGGEIVEPPDNNPPLEEALRNLAAFDKTFPQASAEKQALAQWHRDRLEHIKAVLAADKKPEGQLIYNKQAINELSEAYKTGFYPDGAGRLDMYIAKGGKLGSFAAYRKLQAEADLEADQPGANLMQVQLDLVKKLEGFLEKYAESDDEPDALLQLATIHEFNNNEKESTTYYKKLAAKHPASEAGKRAAGALRRLSLDGQVLKLSGLGLLDGKPVSVDAYRGKPLLVMFWTTASEPDRRELDELGRLRQKFKDKGFEILGVNLDSDRATLDAFLKDNSLPWPQIFEPGGMDSRLANEFGILSTPTMFLVDAQGKVLSRKIRKAAEVEKALDKPLAGRSTTSVNLGRRD